MSLLRGAILAGGGSARMGRDKALVELDGRPLIEWVAAALVFVTPAVVIAGREGKLAGLECIPDDAPGGGPLAGLAAALAWAGSGRLIVVAVDQPFVRPATLEALAALAAPATAVIPVAGSVRQVTCAVYPGEWGAAAHAEVAAGGSLQSLVDRLGCRAVGEEEWRGWGEDGRSWYSVDTPAALEEGVRRYAGTEA